MQTYQGIIVDAISRRKFKGKIVVENGKIISIKEKEHENEQYILPGLVDAHVHIESSMIVTSVFANGLQCLRFRTYFLENNFDSIFTGRY